MPEIAAPIVDHAVALTHAANQTGISLRLVGSAALVVRCREAMGQTAFEFQQPRDLDFVCSRLDAPSLDRFLVARGYRQDRSLQIATEGRRWTLTAEDGSHCLDVFFDELQFSHRLDLRGRISVDSLTIPAADLLLAQLQFVQPTRLQVAGIVVLLATHDLADRDGDALNASRVVAVLARSWGYCYTAMANLRRAAAAAASVFEESPVLESLARQHSTTLLSRIELAPKSLRWRLRARIGTRIKWYEEVENGAIF